MIRRLLVYFLVGTLVMWAPMTTVLADESGIIHKPELSAWAAGKGFLHLEGKGKMVIESAGGSVILVKNVAVTKVMVQGKATVIPLPKEKALLVVNLKGHVKLAGGKIMVTSHGGPVVLKTHGHGHLWLKGKGLFKIKDKPKHKWPDEVKKFCY